MLNIYEVLRPRPTSNYDAAFYIIMPHLLESQK